jgi:Enoyl-(Acyl carrier protein) reductase
MRSSHGGEGRRLPNPRRLGHVGIHQPVQRRLQHRQGGREDAVPAVRHRAGPERRPQQLRASRTRAHAALGSQLPQRDFRRRREAAVPLRRISGPEDVARAALFLASPLAGYVNGTEVVVDGSFTSNLMSLVLAHNPERRSAADDGDLTARHARAAGPFWPRNHRRRQRRSVPTPTPAGQAATSCLRPASRARPPVVRLPIDRHPLAPRQR